MSWELTVHTKSRIWSYLTHIFRIKITPIPPRIFRCEVPQWIECESYLYENQEWYDWKVSTPWIVHLSNERFFNWNNQKEDRLKIATLQTWETDVYIYRWTDHVATVEVKVLPKTPPIRFQESRIRIKQLETATTQVISWWWEYARDEYDSTLIWFWVENDGSEIHIRGIQPWTTHPSIKDQYNQTATIEVIVEDLNLELVKYEFQLNPGQEETVYFIEYYSEITSLVKNNENAKIYLDQDEQGKYLRIEWIEEWITIFQVTDVEWNSKTGKITVWPGSVTEPENPEEPVEPEPVPEEDETPEEKELREFLEELENLSNGVQVNALTEEQQVSLEEYKVIVDAIIVKFKAKNFSDARISAAITAVQNVKDIISTGTSTKKELYVEVLDYLIGGLQELLNIEISQFKSLLLLNDSETQELQNIIAFNIELEYQEVWVIFKDENGSYIRQTIEKDIDGYYIVQADTNLCTECISEFQPYIINNVWNYIYPNGLWNYLSFSDENKFRNIAIAVSYTHLTLPTILLV